MAGLHSWLLEKFLKFHPVVAREAEQTGKHSWEREPRGTTISDMGVLEIVHSEFNPDFMLSHEIGHVIAATDEELFLPNLGLPPITGPGSSSGSAKEAYNEAFVIAAQIILYRRFGKDLEDRSIQVGSSVFGQMIDMKEGPKLWKAAVEKHLREWTYRKLRKEWFRKMRLISARNRATCEARQAQAVGAA